LQLPPVCTVEREVLVRGIETDGIMRYGFMWCIPALFAESFFTKGIEWLQNAYLEELDPVFELTQRADLTVSHRFGNNFAEILNECIYMNGITGVSQYPLEIECINAVAGKRESRANYEEMEKIRKFLADNPMEEGEYVILTPYTAQVNVLRDNIPGARENVLTVHRSQGREWDTVILSVADSGTVDREVQLRFTSTVNESSIGRKVINTAVSRAKKNLIVVCDKEFWSQREGELIGKLATHTE
jgi:superfamily I DNA/RNA helicase